MTDNSIREQPDEQSDNTWVSPPVSPKPARQDKKKDIVGSTRLPLLSLPGLDQTPFLPLLNEPKGRAIVPAPNNKGEEGAIPPSEIPFVPSSRAFHDTGSLPYTARLAGPPPVPVDQKATERRVKRPVLFFFLFILLCFLLLFGIGASIYMHAGTVEHKISSSSRPVPIAAAPRSTIALATRYNFASSEGESFPVGEQSTLVIGGQHDDVNVAVGNAGTIIIKASSKSQSADAINQSIHYSRSKDGQGYDVINITTIPGYENIDYNVMVPASTQVKVGVNSGSVSVVGVSGVNIDTNSGSLNIADISGPVNVYTTNGDVTAQNIKGQMAMESVNGSVRATVVVGQLKAVTQNGDVVVREATLNGQSTMKTNYGSVRFSGTIDPQGTYTLGTHNGNVNLALPGNSTFQLHANTASGSIYNEFGRNIVGNAPLAQITISIMGGGSIAINKSV